MALLLSLGFFQTALLICPSGAWPLPAPATLLQARDEGEDSDSEDDKDLQTSPNIIVIISVCIVVGILGICATTVLLLIRRRRRHSTAPINSDPPTETSFPPTTTPSEKPKIHTSCSWCYISDSGLCKWCAGEADDSGIVDIPQRQLFMESGGDVKQNGWVSVLNSPSGSGYNTPRRTMSPAGSGCNTPRRTKSPSGSVHTLVAPVSPVSPGGSLTGKRSFRPGGIYEVASQEGLSVPGKGEDGERRGARLM